MRVLVYVEGPSDRYALEALLEPVIATGQANGVGIRFLPLNDKTRLLNDSGRKAADHIADHPEDWVFSVPDLYPMGLYAGTANEHQSSDDLFRILRERFAERARRIGLREDLYDHFRVHCLKHDLEALLLADREALRRRLGTAHALQGHWRQPVEDQNDHHPPKRIVEALFSRYRRKPRYVDTVDAPWILKRASLEVIRQACPQRFAPFVADLQALASRRAGRRPRRRLPGPLNAGLAD